MTINRKQKAVPPVLVSAPVAPLGHVPGRSLRSLGEQIRALGGNPDAVFRAANVDEALLFQPEAFLPIATRGELLERATQETGCEHFGLLLGFCSGIDILGPLGEMISRHSTVGSALEAFVASWLQNNTATVIFLRRFDDQATLGYAVTEGNLPGMPHLQDAAIALVLNVMRSILGADWRPVGVNLMRSEPRDSALHARVFGVECRFNAVRSELIFPAATLDIHFQNTAALDAGPVRPFLSDQDWCAYVGRVAYHLLLQGECSQKRVAAVLGISDRTLVRRLANCGMRYQQLIERVRFSASRALIRETNLQFSEIAAALGYNEASSFTRAFARWSGMSPAQWRKAKGRQTKLQSGKECNGLACQGGDR